MLRAFQWDLARQVENLDHLLALLPRYAEWGYQRLYLHLEDAIDYPSLPGVARADAYTWEEFTRLVAAATAHGIAVVPIANLLGHTQYLIKTPEWRDLNELRDPTTGEALPIGQICPLHPRTAVLVERLFTDLAPLCTAGEIHCGLDESFHLGKHPLSRAEVAEIGLATHFARHVLRLHAAAARHGLRLGLWADMLALLPEAIPLLAAPPPPATQYLSGSSPANNPAHHLSGSPPTNNPTRHLQTPALCNQIGYTTPPPPLPVSSGLVAYDWYYHPFARQPRMELRNFADYDLAPALASAGIAYWACPMNGAFRHEAAPVWTDRLQNLAAWWHRAEATQAAGYLVTSWEPYRLALPTTTLLSAAAATLWLDPTAPTDPASLLAAGLRRLLSPRHFVTKLVTLFSFSPALYPNLPASRPNAVSSALCNQTGYTMPSASAARSFARRLLATDVLAFCGNSRWEINASWAPVAGRRDSPAPHVRAARQLTRLAELCRSSCILPVIRSGTGVLPVIGTPTWHGHPARDSLHLASPETLRLPPTDSSPLASLSATLRFQAYLAHREVFVRTAYALTHRLRRAVTRSPNSKNTTALIVTLTEACVVFTDQLRAARSAARAMWTASRPAATFATSQNAALLAADTTRLRSLRAWLRSAARRPAAAVFRASPVCGRWTLRFTVHHFAPCHQKLVVEQLLPAPATTNTAAAAPPIWRELHARVLIEFRAVAAQPRTPHLRFEFAVPVSDPDAPLRIAARCLGEFAVSHIELTDGVTTRLHRPLRTRHVLGTPAPAKGWPPIDWATNTATLPLLFSSPARN